jgi:hypothetical protein
MASNQIIHGVQAAPDIVRIAEIIGRSLLSDWPFAFGSQDLNQMTHVSVFGRD